MPLQFGRTMNAVTGPIFQRQVRMLRGLHGRLAKLKASRAGDEQALEVKLSESKKSFSQLEEDLRNRHFASRRDSITNWDEQLDKQMALAERSTLESLQLQKSGSRRLKKEFNENKARTKSEFESATSELKRRTEESKKGLARFRDSLLEKLETQRSGIEQQMNEVREWIGLRTGNMDLQNLQSTLTMEPDSTVTGLAELQSVAKEFEVAKMQLSAEIKRVRSHPAASQFGTFLFIGFGFIVGALAAAVAWLADLGPMILGLAGLFAAIIATAIAYLAAAPWITRTVGRMIPSVVDQDRRVHWILNQGRRIAEANYQNEFAKLNQSHAENQFRLEADYKVKRTKLVETYNDESAKLESECRTKRQSVAKTRASSQSVIDELEKPNLILLQQQQSDEQLQLDRNKSRRFSGLQEDFLRSQRHVVERWSHGCKRSSERMQNLLNRSHESMPDWGSDAFTRGDWPRVSNTLAWRLGHLLPRAPFSQSLEDLKLPTACQLERWPVFYDVTHQGSLIVHATANCKEASNALVRNVLLRATTSLPPGMLNTTIIDPEGLGKQFTWLMSLADVDASLVNHRVWTQPLQIADQLALAARHVEDSIQQSLRDRYRNLVEYNQHAGPMAVPYRLLVWSNFPLGLDDHSWQSLCSILSSGGKCGVGVILQIAPSYAWPTFADPAKLREFGLHVVCENLLDGIRVDHQEFSHFVLVPDSPPAESRIQEIMQHQIDSVSNLGRRIVPFESIAPSESEIQSTASAEGLSIPLGVSDSGRTQYLKLGQGTSQHVVIAGKTGSGKSSLLHTMITSASLKYSPEQLRLVLLDFKKGVEFQVYAESKLSHADVIGIESKREFGVSVLEYIDRILSARGEAFRHWGVQDLPSLSRKYPDQSLPRILVLIDEFQELFVEDDKLSQQASLLMDRIVRQGRSFGVHLVLASQTLGGAYSIPRTTLSQMAVRIALQCDSNDAMLILSEDNTAAQRLRHSGQAVYNESGGRIESNQNFQVSYIEKSDQLVRLNQLPRMAIPQTATTNPLGRQVVFEGHKPAVLDLQQIELAMYSHSKDGMSPTMFLGDSVSIDPPVVKNLARAPGRNVMVVGGDEITAASLLGGVAAGVSNRNSESDVKASNTKLIILDGTRNEESSLKRCIAAIGESSLDSSIPDVRAIDSTMQLIQDELQRRSSEPDASYSNMIIAIVNLSRFRELRRGDEFAFGEEAAGAIKPDAVLANVLRDGPALGMFVWIWADSASSITRWLSRQSLRDIEVRVLMQMSASDSNQLIDTNAANRLERYIALIQDDLDGKPIKFRPFELQSILSAIR